MSRIVVVGSINADFVIEVDRLPVRGETIAANKPDTGRFFPGGKGANQAAVIARLLRANDNSKCTFVCQFGNDVNGTELQKALNDVGVDTSLAGHPSCPSGQAFVFVYPDGNNSIVIVGGANVAWPSTLPEPVVSAIQGASIVLLQNEIPSEVNYQVARCAAQANVPVMWDLGGEDRTIPQDMLSFITYLCPNETELARASGLPVTTMDDAVVAARQLQAKGANNVIVTLGSLGSVYIPADSADSVIHHTSINVSNVVDTTGAGDCFRGVFAVALSQGKSIKDCLAMSTCASALCIQVSGALPSMPTEQATMALMESIRNEGSQ